MKQHTLLWFLFGTLLLGSCEKVVEFRVEEMAPQLVLVSKPECDSTLCVNLHYSRFFLDQNPFRPVENASVTLWCNGQQVPQAVADTGFYRFSRAAQAGDSLSVEVYVPGFDTVRAVTQVPDRPRVTLVEALADSLYQYGFHTYSVSATLRLHAVDELTYFQLRFRGVQRRYIYDDMGLEVVDSVLVYDAARFGYNDSMLVDVPTISSEFSYGHELRFTNQKFLGQEHDVTVSLTFLTREAFELFVNNSMELEVSVLSPELYRYIEGTEANLNLTAYMSEPVQIHNNVTHALGIFGGMSRRRLPVVLD